MNTKMLLLFATFCTTFLIASTTALAENFVQIQKGGVFVRSGNSGVNITGNGVSIRSGSGGINVNKSGAPTTRQYRSSFQRQQTAISLNSANLRLPHILSISAARGTQLTGQVTVNGVVVQKLKNNGTSINLSPYLLKGRQIRGRQAIEISGNYKPVWSSVRVKLSGPSTTVNQQMGGNGILRQTLIVDVR